MAGSNQRRVVRMVPEVIHRNQAQAGEKSKEQARVTHSWTNEAESLEKSQGQNQESDNKKVQWQARSVTGSPKNTGCTGARSTDR